MKISLILTVIILLAAAGLYQYQRQDAGRLRNEISVMRSGILAEGLDPDAAARGQGAVPLAVPGAGETEAAAKRADHESDIRAFAQELILFAVEMKASEKIRKGPDAEQQKRIMAIMARFMDLSETDIRLVIGEMKTTSALDDKAKREMLGMSIMMLGQSNPAAGLQLFSETREFMGEAAGMARQMAGMCLATWAGKDPAAALAWMDKKENADMVTGDTRRMALTGVARSNPALAMQRLQSSKTAKQGDASATASMIGSNAKPEDRLALLAAAEAALPDPSGSPEERKEASKRAMEIKQGVLGGIGQSLANGDFEESAAWINRSGLSEAARYEVTKKVAASLWGKDPSPWLGWIGKEITEPAQIKELTGQIVPSWTQRDFNGVGQWINTQEQGPLRTEVTRSFASSLKEKEPEAAARWALTLPESPDRTTLLRNIQEQWQTKDEAAAGAFAAQHGL